MPRKKSTATKYKILSETEKECMIQVFNYFKVSQKDDKGKKKKKKPNKKRKNPAQQTADAFGCSKATVYRALDQQKRTGSCKRKPMAEESRKKVRPPRWVLEVICHQVEYYQRNGITCSASVLSEWLRVTHGVDMTPTRVRRWLKSLGYLFKSKVCL